jgi:hypothetical protein
MCTYFICIYIFIWKNYPFAMEATTTGVAVFASKICLHIIKLYTVHTKNNIYSEMSHNFSLRSYLVHVKHKLIIIRCVNGGFTNKKSNSFH